MITARASTARAVMKKDKWGRVLPYIVVEDEHGIEQILAEVRMSGSDGRAIAEACAKTIREM